MGKCGDHCGHWRNSRGVNLELFAINRLKRSSKLGTKSLLSVLESGSFAGFADASFEISQCLMEVTDFDLWMVTRVIGDDYLVLCCVTSKYEIYNGDVFSWNDSICSRMISTNGPRIVPDILDNVLYSQAPLVGRFPIRAYAGTPILMPDGSLFGMLCGLSRDAQTSDVKLHESSMLLCSKLLSTIVAFELERCQLERLVDKLELETSTTGGDARDYDRSAWKNMLAAEDDRVHRLAQPVSIALVTLLESSSGECTDAILEDAIERAIISIKGIPGIASYVARVGSDQLAIVVCGVYGETAESYARSVQKNLKLSGIYSRTFCKSKRPEQSLVQLFEVMENA